MLWNAAGPISVPYLQELMDLVVPFVLSHQMRFVKEGISGHKLLASHERSASYLKIALDEFNGRFALVDSGMRHDLPEATTHDLGMLGQAKGDCLRMYVASGVAPRINDHAVALV